MWAGNNLTFRIYRHKIFEILDVTIIFLEKDTEEQDKSYANEILERGIQLMKEHYKMITDDEMHTQCIIRIVIITGCHSQTKRKYYSSYTKTN